MNYAAAERCTYAWPWPVLLWDITAVKYETTHNDGCATLWLTVQRSLAQSAEGSK